MRYLKKADKMKKLITQLANILKDYRSDERLNPTSQIIQKWIGQFAPENPN